MTQQFITMTIIITHAAHAASAYGGESAGTGFLFQGGAATFVLL